MDGPKLYLSMAFGFRGKREGYFHHLELMRNCVTLGHVCSCILMKLWLN